MKYGNDEAWGEWGVEAEQPAPTEAPMEAPAPVHDESFTPAKTVLVLKARAMMPRVWNSDGRTVSYGEV